MKIKRIVALVMTVAFMLCCAAMPVAAEKATFSDLEGSGWAAGSIERWADVKVLDGYGDGTFGPTKFMTRGEFAKVLAVTLGLDDKLPADTFKDLDADEWYAPYVLLCADAEIMKGHDNGNVDAEGYITREQAFAMIVRAFHIAPITDEAKQAEVLKGFADKDEISNWALSEVAAIVECGAVVGEVYGDDMIIKSQDSIKRQELVKILDRLIIAYVDADGKVSLSSAFDEKDPDFDKTGNIVVVNQNCTKEVIITKGTDEKGNPVVNVSVTGVGDASNIPVKNDKQAVVVVEKESAPVGNEPVIVDDRNNDNKGAFHKHEFKAPEACTYTCEVTHTEAWKCACGAEDDKNITAKPHVFNADGKCEVCGKTNKVDGDELGTAVKFYLGVISDGDSVKATVTDDYVATIEVTPGEVDASKVTLEAAMQNVDSLEVGKARKHSVEINTGIDNTKADLTDWLGSVWTFNDAIVNVNVTNDGKTVSASYEVKGVNPVADDFDKTKIEENAVITATPAGNNVDAVRKAWHAIVNDNTIETATKEEDSYIKIANGSKLVVLDESLEFDTNYDKDFLELNDFGKISDMKEEIKKAVVLNTVEKSDKYQITAVLKAGTELAVGSSVATLKEDCIVGINGLTEDDFKGVLNELRANSDNNKVMVKSLVEMLDKIIASADKTGTLTVDFILNNFQIGIGF